MARIKRSAGQFEAPNPKLMGPVKWSCCHLYVILDIDRRRVTGWRIEHAESAIQFKALFQVSMAKHAVSPDQLTLHAATTHFCGAPMKAKATALMQADPRVVKSHSRSHTSNDNPFSDSHFKTLKYQPEFPKRFQTTHAARAFCRRFFAWYNQDHHPAGIGLMTPESVPLQANGRPRCGIPQHTRAVRPPTAKTATGPDRRLDQPTEEHAGKPSLKFKSNCRKIVDRFRRTAAQACPRRLAAGLCAWQADPPALVA